MAPTTPAMVPPDLVDLLTSEEVLQEAYYWMCARRQHYSAHDDVWDLRWRWDELRPLLQQQLRAGRYRFAPLRRVRVGEERFEIWSAPDALVLKALALV